MKFGIDLHCICNLFNDPVIQTDVASNDWMVVNVELERMWKEAVKYRPGIFLEGMRRTTKYFRAVGCPANT
jgi:hypothetical protein